MYQNNETPSAPLVTVIVTTYKHVRFIAQCLESVVTQKTDFSYEVIIGEDESPDGTREICKQYAEKYPEKIRLFLRSRKDVIYVNGQPTGRYNMLECLKAAKGKYIAFCEGDDYWVDPNKLQMQVDFLEQNPDFSMCFSDVEVVKEMEIDDYYKPPVKEVYEAEDLILNGYFIMTPTLVIRNVLKEFPPYFTKIIWADIAIHLLMIDKGKGRYFDQKTAAYRRHAASISHQQNNREYVTYTTAIFELFDGFNEYTNRRHHEVIRKKLQPLSKELLIYGTQNKKGAERQEHIKKMFRGYNKYKEAGNVKEMAYYLCVLYMPKLLKAYQKVFVGNKETA